MVWRSSLLEDCGTPHLFTTRDLNARSADDLVDLVATARWFGANDPPARIVLSKQVHGCAVDTPGSRLAEADAHVTDEPWEVVAVRTADCVPVLLSTADGKLVAALHAGWRGLDPAVGVLGRAVAAMLSRGSVSGVGELSAAVGPCISVPNYEVGEEVASRFRDRYPDALRDDLGDKPHLDTRAVAVAQLREAGVAAERIDVFPGCTYEDAEAFFSFRREGKGVGHLAALITPRQ